MQLSTPFNGRKVVNTPLGRSFGFSLLEVMISIVVVAIGLLGVAGLQVTAIKLADTAQVRTSGAALVSNITERIRTNPANVSSYALSYGTVPATGASQAQRDLYQWRDTITQLPDGDASIVVSTDASCPTVPITINYRTCSLVTVNVRWSETRHSRSSAGGPATPVTFTASTRI
jgi:type IV pilus assembly protein PilV